MGAPNNALCQNWFVGGSMNTVIEDSLVFRVETDEFVFEQWNLAVPISQKKAHPETS